MKESRVKENLKNTNKNVCKSRRIDLKFNYIEKFIYFNEEWNEKRNKE